MQLIDTNIFIDHFRKYEPAAKFLESLREEEVIFSAITEAELITGEQCNNKEIKDNILQFLSKWQKIIVNNQIAVLSGDIMRKNRKNGLELGDAIIAATAIINKAELLTKNVKDFEKVEGLKVREPY